MKLFTYFRSSAAYRVRIALKLKGLEPEAHAVALDGAQHAEDFRAINPQSLVPALMLDDGTVLTQSLAIMEYLDETWPEPPFLPAGREDRARVRALAQMVACEIHPLNNTRVRNYLTDTLHLDGATSQAWYAHWIRTGFEAIEQLIGADGYCHGGRVTLADICLVPQVYNARRFEVDLADFPKIRAVEATCGALEAFAAAHPDRQPDAPATA